MSTSPALAAFVKEIAKVEPKEGDLLIIRYEVPTEVNVPAFAAAAKKTLPKGVKLLVLPMSMRPNLYGPQDRLRIVREILVDLFPAREGDTALYETVKRLYEECRSFVGAPQASPIEVQEMPAGARTFFLRRCSRCGKLDHEDGGCDVEDPT